MVEEVMFEVEQAERDPTRSAVGRYTTKFQTALDNMGAAFPKLIDEAAFGTSDLPGIKRLGSAQAARDFFTALIAVTSDGQKVEQNFELARRVYDQFRMYGTIDSDVSFGGKRNTSMRINLASIRGRRWTDTVLTVSRSIRYRPTRYRPSSG